MGTHTQFFEEAKPHYSIRFLLKEKSKDVTTEGWGHKLNFFMLLQMQRKKSNTITSLAHEDGSIAYDHCGFYDAVSYFQNLFQANNNCNDFDPLSIKFPWVSSYENDSFFAPFTIDEFKTALFQMNYNKFLS